MKLQIDDPQLQALWEAAKAAGSIQQPKQGTALAEEKTDAADLVTDVDKETEVVIENRLTESYPSYEILSEEHNSATTLREDTYTWIIDPIDGTLNYAHGMPLYCVSIALYQGTTPVVGGVYAPELDRFYYARRGSGAYRNETELQVSATETLDEAYLSMDITRLNDSHETLLPLFREITKHGHGAVQIMSAALSLAFVAEGAVDGSCLRGLSPWDFAAGALLVTEAGGTVSSYSGETGWHALETGNVVGTNGAIHQPLLDRYAALG